MSDLPTEKAVRGALARLVSRGVGSVWLPDVQPLFELPAVRRKLGELGEDQAAEALHAVLEEAVAGLGQSQYRSLLTMVLGLEPRYAQLSAGEKRQIAGREFRGGKRPVSAGTIRQHHEPRALEDLAARLVASASQPPWMKGGSTKAVGETARQSLEWHPSLHQKWAGETLVFWRLSLSGYRPQDAINGVRLAMRQADVRSWAVYELLGVFDLMISAWIPARMPESDARSALIAIFGGGLELVDSLLVAELLFSSTWASGDGSLRLPDDQVLSRPLPSSEIDRLNREVADLDLKAYEGMNVVSRLSPDPGIGFFISVALEGNALAHAEALRRLDRGIAEVARDTDRGGFNRLSVYRGSGFASFLIHGSVRFDRFSDISDLLIERISEVVPFANCRTTTFITSSDLPVAQEEAMREGDDSQSTRPGIDELLEQGEGPHLEVKGSAFTDLRRWDGSSERQRRSRPAIDSLVSAITALLNSDGGVLIIGALEKDLVDRVRELDESPIVEGARDTGGFLVTGIDHELGHGVDEFESRLLSMFKDMIEPDPRPFLEVDFESADGRTVCIVRALGDKAAVAGKWFYSHSSAGGMKFFVRKGSATAALEGPSADDYKEVNSR